MYVIFTTKLISSWFGKTWPLIGKNSQKLKVLLGSASTFCSICRGFFSPSCLLLFPLVIILSHFYFSCWSPLWYVHFLRAKTHGRHVQFLILNTWKVTHNIIYKCTSKGFVFVRWCKYCIWGPRIKFLMIVWKLRNCIRSENARTNDL